MTPIEKQILKNQATILQRLADHEDANSLKSISNRLSETSEFFQESKEEPCCEMPEEEPDYTSLYTDHLGKKEFALARKGEGQ